MIAIVWPEAQPSAREVGGKGAALASAQRAGLPVPRWFALPPSVAFTDIGPALTAALARLSPRGEPVAVRSSALEEDGAALSFAGQLDSHLFVPPEKVAERIADVWRSGSAARARAYREHHGCAAEAGAPAVLVQRMVRADAAGVAFSADPVSGRRGMAVVAAVPGVAAGLVAGERDADTFHVDREGRVALRRLTGTHACLSEAQAAEVAALARRCESHFGRPQDIEWALEGGRLWLLQSRPITSLAGLADPDGALAVWDSSNIAESYGGLTTPLTFSFIRRCYEHVYRELARLGGVSAQAIRANDENYRRMLGFVRGRVYYNLLAWYRLLALAPGFRHNRRFLDEMLGVGDEAQAEALAQVRAPSGWRVKAALARQIGRALLHQLTADAINRRFRVRLDAALTPPATPLAAQRIDELAAHFRSLEDRLLRSWDAPLINDFLAMIFHGVLRRLIARWLPAADGGLDNHLLSGEGGVISVEPVRRVREMARLAAAEPQLAAALREAPLAQALEHLQGAPRLHSLFLEYLQRFCDRCPEELKLESVALDENPLPLLRAVGELAVRGGPAQAAPEPRLREQAQARVARALRRHPVRQAIFAWVLRNARARVRDRENLRFERTRVFARVRRIFVEIGKRLQALDVLDEARDVFYLELDEVLGFVDGTTTCTDLRGLAAVRTAELERHRSAEAPPRRFATRGVGQIALGLVHAAPVAPEGGEARQGTGCCPGVVRGPARVVARAEDARLLPGEILVAERTDPGWVMLFASAGGLVVERGSLLSHAAIVAREMALPAVVGVPGACRWLRDGDLIELDGTAGTVRRL